MSLLSEAFNLPINSENQDFVTHPYVPIPTLIYPNQPEDRRGYVKVQSLPLTIARCFDIKHGARACFQPAHCELSCDIPK